MYISYAQKLDLPLVKASIKLKFAVPTLPAAVVNLFLIGDTNIIPKANIANNTTTYLNILLFVDKLHNFQQ